MRASDREFRGDAVKPYRPLETGLIGLWFENNQDAAFGALECGQALGVSSIWQQLGIDLANCVTGRTRLSGVGAGNARPTTATCPNHSLFRAKVSVGLALRAAADKRQPLAFAGGRAVVFTCHLRRFAGKVVNHIAVGKIRGLRLDQQAADGVDVAPAAGDLDLPREIWCIW